MTAQSIDAGSGGDYGRYLEGKTLAPERGSYYLTPEGEPQQPPGRWLASADTLARLGIDGQAIDGPDFVALMEGKHPRTGAWIRAEGAGGGRGGGIDITFSAPKSVSIQWALSTQQGREMIEAAHSAAVSEALSYLRTQIPVIRRRRKESVYEEHASDLLAAEYRHTTARGVRDGELPDPHMHSHVVITSAVRDDGRIVAVASRPVFRAAREVGAFYRSALAAQLSAQGFQIEARTGRHGRYFELADIDADLKEAFSRRSREVANAAERFRARYGRAPRRGELRQLKANNRLPKKLIDRGDLDRAWQQLAREHSGVREHREHAPRSQGPLEQRVEQRLTEHTATFTPGELRATVLEQSVGQLTPAEAITRAKEMTASRMIVPLEGGRMTTLKLRATEQQIERRLAEIARPAGRDVGDQARQYATDRVAERIGARLTPEQSEALATITGPERAAILIGPAGTGKGVVIDAAAQAEQLTGHTVYGIAVAGSTAQRLGYDSPALQGRTLTLDGLTAGVEKSRLPLDARSTIFLDEAGMTDTRRLAKLTDLVDRTGAKLVLIGDGKQLPSIGAGGMFEHLEKKLPTVELTDVKRTTDPAEQRAWADMRAGRADKAMAYYHATGRLQMEDTREQAIERAAQAWASLTRKHDPSEVLLISDASNQEIDRINARAQQLRAQQGKLGQQELPIPGLHYGIRTGDRILLIDQHHQQDRPRIENGSRGHVVHITPHGEAVVEFDITGQRRTLAGEDLASLRLAYAQHIHRAQGATVQHSLVITGGWQASREAAYVQATRARESTTWFVARDELGSDGQDTDRITRLSALMQNSRAQTPSLDHHAAEPPQIEHPLYETLQPGLLGYLHRLTGRTSHPAEHEIAGRERTREIQALERSR